jgi:putative transposase
MARLGRYFLPGQPLHVIQRGNDRAPIFFEDEDRRLYLAWLAEAAAQLPYSLTPPASSVRRGAGAGP